MSASRISTHGWAACGMAQFLKSEKSTSSRSITRQPPIWRTISSVPSVEPESATRISSAIERADHVHVGVDGALREFESQWGGVWILSNVWFCAHIPIVGDKSGPERVSVTLTEFARRANSVNVTETPVWPRFIPPIAKTARS